MRSREARILISEPHAVGYPFPFLPYVWAILKSYWEHHGESDRNHEWLDPIFRHDEPERLLAPYEGDRIDLLGLSCYFWNWSLQCRVAARVKELNPSCWVIAGGPEPDYTDPGFFRRHPYIDAVAVKDGEITFGRILSASERDDLREIPGLYLPGKNGGEPISTGPAAVPIVFDHSPYLEQSAFYERLLEEHGPGAFHATLETNRGCPYACSFCDWGSSTMSKVRRFDLDRVEAEIDFLGRMKVGLIFSADANLGILERDVGIAKRLAEARRKHGFPRQLYYSAAKNNPDRVVEIARVFAEAGISPTHTLAIQHTRPEVLAATDRANISADKQVEVARALHRSGIPIDVQLILGIPGDTADLWRSCLTDLMERGLHEEYWVFFYHVLPNAPAAQKAFTEKWQTETIERCVLASAEAPWHKQDREFVNMSRGRLIVQSRTFSREDWVAMQTFTAFVKPLHNSSIVRLIAVYLRLTHRVPYREFYDGVMDDFLPQSALARRWLEAVRDHYRNYLEDENALDRMEIEELTRYEFLVTPDRWVQTQIGLNLEEFFSEFTAYLRQRFSKVKNLPSLIEYQRNLVILPDYDREAGKRFPTALDWPRYFELTHGLTGSETLAEPEPTPGATICVSDQTCGEKGYLVTDLLWGQGDEQERWIEWLQRTVLHRNSSAKSTFQELQIDRPAPLAATARGA